MNKNLTKKSRKICVDDNIVYSMRDLYDLIDCSPCIPVTRMTFIGRMHELKGQYHFTTKELENLKTKKIEPKRLHNFGDMVQVRGVDIYRRWVITDRISLSGFLSRYSKFQSWPLALRGIKRDIPNEEVPTSNNKYFNTNPFLPTSVSPVKKQA